MSRPPWFLSRRRRNRLMHALNGNVQPTAPTASWQRAGRGLLNARELGEPQLVSKLRSAGWTLPTTVKDDQVLRVYDVRMDPTWLRGAVTDLAVPAGPIYMVGGDFSMQPYRDDALALQTGKLSRWGPIEETPVHLVVPPSAIMWVCVCSECGNNGGVNVWVPGLPLVVWCRGRLALQCGTRQP